MFFSSVLIFCLLFKKKKNLQMVRDENLKFMKNRDVYSSDYFSFVLSLASLNAVSNETLIFEYSEDTD